MGTYSFPPRSFIRPRYQCEAVSSEKVYWIDTSMSPAVAFSVLFSSDFWTLCQFDQMKIVVRTATFELSGPPFWPSLYPKSARKRATAQEKALINKALERFAVIDGLECPYYVEMNLFTADDAFAVSVVENNIQECEPRPLHTGLVVGVTDRVALLIKLAGGKVFPVKKMVELERKAA